MVYNSNEDGNMAFYVKAKNAEASDVTTVSICWDNLTAIAELLSVPVGENAELGVDNVYNQSDGRSFMIIYNPVFEKPYPAVVIAKYEKIEDDDLVIIDVEQDDLDVEPHVRKDFLVPKELPQISLKLKSNPDEDDAVLLTKLAIACEYGTAFEQNYASALHLYEIAGKAGNAKAIANYGRMYLKGLGTEKNIASAVEFFKIAAKAGNTEAMARLGAIYESDELGEPDYEKAFKWYNKAADAGDDIGLLGCAYCYHQGNGVEKDHETAFSMFKYLADKGCESAYYYVGLYYQNGDSVEQNYELARKYYRLGALVDDPACINQLGIMYLNGQGVMKDIHAAVDYFKEAAKYNYPIACISLAVVYETGAAGEKNLNEALKYYKVAAEHGYEVAIEAVERLSGWSAIDETDGQADFQAAENVRDDADDNSANPSDRAVYYLINDRILGKKDTDEYYLYQDGQWILDAEYVIRDHIVGFDPSEPPDSPYGYGNHSIMEEMREITEEEALDFIKNLDV